TCCFRRATHQFPIAMLAKLEEVTSAAPLWDCCNSAVRQRLKRIPQLPHHLKPAEKISMPECKAVREEESKFKREMRPHHFKSEMRIEVNHDGAGQYCLRWTTSRIESDHRSPANLLNEPLLKSTP